MSLFEATKKKSNNLEKLYYASHTKKHISGTREGFFSHRTICHKTQKLTEWWKYALIVMHQFYKHLQNTVLNLINNSLINCAVTTVVPSKSGVSNTRPARTFLCGLWRVWEISCKQHLSYLVYSTVFKNSWPASEQVPFKRTLRLLNEHKDG